MITIMIMIIIHKKPGSSGRNSSSDQLGFAIIREISRPKFCCAGAAQNEALRGDASMVRDHWIARSLGRLDLLG